MRGNQGAAGTLIIDSPASAQDEPSAPDIILVGEMRDRETIAVAITAAEMDGEGRLAVNEILIPTSALSPA